MKITSNDIGKTVLYVGYDDKKYRATVVELVQTSRDAKGKYAKITYYVPEEIDAVSIYLPCVTGRAIRLPSPATKAEQQS